MEGLDTYEGFVIFVANLIVMAKRLSEENYKAWKEECIREAEKRGSLEFTRKLMDVLDKHTGRTRLSIVTEKR